MRAAAVALIILVLAAVASLYALASVAAMPAQQPVSTPYYSYSGTTNFNYLASLRPNILYNQTTLGPGEGILFTNLVASINLSYDFVATFTAASNITLIAGFAVTLAAPSAWNYSLNSSAFVVPQRSMALDDSVSVSTFVNMSTVSRIVATIASETGVVPVQFYLNFTGPLILNVNSGGHASSYTFSPILSFVIGSSEMTPGPLSSTFAQSVTHDGTVTNTGRNQDLIISGILTAGFVVAAGVAGYYAARPRPRSTRAQVKEFTEPYRDAIAVTSTPPKRAELVVLADWLDLVHVADMLGKPILHWEWTKSHPTRHLFYVLDYYTQYVYLVPAEGRPDEEILSELR